MSGAELRVDGVDVSFADAHVLRDVTLCAAPSEVVALLGASGSGKSTLLRVIAGLVAPDRGTVTVDGVDVTTTATHRRGVGMVFQDNQLFPHRSVGENVAFGLKMQGVGRSERRTRADASLERVELGGFAGRRVTDLSGGEAKRVALARTLATDPSVVLLDEPLTGLDRELHDQLVAELARLLHTADATAVLVTHDVDEANAIADRTVALADLQDGGASMTAVVELDAAAVHDLRRRVLRDGDLDAGVDWSGDHDRTTVHLGVVDEAGSVLAVSTWLRHPCPLHPAEPAVQLRGMATEPACRGTGLGSQLLSEGLHRSSDVGLVWANARVEAITFYERHGWTATGPVFVTAETGLPHRVVTCRPPRPGS